MHLTNLGGGALLTSFLMHGTHPWDSLFSPALAFGYLHDDVDALEAVGAIDGDFELPVPEPASVLLMLFGIAGIARCRRRA
jgi:hypothetical protein